MAASAAHNGQTAHGQTAARSAAPAADPAYGVTVPVGVEAHDWGWRHSTRKDFALRHVNLSIKPGERVLLLGASGAGKSTFMAAMAGVLGSDDEGVQEGSLTIGGLDSPKARGRAGLVLQDPDAQIILERVGDDVAFGCENLNIDVEETWRRVRSSLDIVGLKSLDLTHSTRHLSGGQRQRLALAGVLAMRPGLLLLDEPTANLDPPGVHEVHDAVKHVIESTGQTMVVVEHHIDVWLDLVDRVVVLGAAGDSHEGGVLADGTPDEVFSTMGDVLAEGGSWVPGRAIPSFPPKRAEKTESPAAPDAGADTGAVDADPVDPDEVVLSTRDLSFGRNGVALGEHVNLDFRRGSIYALMGPNGAGKSTLALTLAGLLKPVAGQVLINERLAPNPKSREPIHWKSRQLLGRIGMVFQEPEHQFAANTVRDEVAIGPKSMGKTQDEAYAIADDLLERLRLARFARGNPYTLSGGEKRRLSVASMLAAAPQVLVMDEPTFGQDFRTWTQMVELIAGIRDRGCTVIMVTHDEALVQSLQATPIRFGVRQDAAEPASRAPRAQEETR
ncbi:ABC transporter ATP-binding protein [Bifidobacterium simiarum]|uniref:ABC transporter ATP-binding protein n=1 Tax=Bifidobacterium simiarum TaxID=2045441 RepID=UPI0013FE439D